MKSGMDVEEATEENYGYIKRRKLKSGVENII
jgi:hypothetical protein